MNWKIIFVFFCLCSISYAAEYDFSNNNRVGNNFVTTDENIYLFDNITLRDKGYTYEHDNVFRMSSEKGDSWSKLNDSYRLISIDKTNSKIMYAVKPDNIFIKTLDGGNSWINMNMGRNSYIKCIFVGNNSNIIYIGTSNGLLVTNDAGFTWNETGLIKEPVEQIIISPQNDNDIYALTRSNGISQLKYSNDSGKNWNNIDNSLPMTTIKGKGRTAQKIPLPVLYFSLAEHDNKQFLFVITQEIISEYVDIPNTNIAKSKNKIKNQEKSTGKQTMNYGKLRIFASYDNGKTWDESKMSFNTKDYRSNLHSVAQSNESIQIGGYRCIYTTDDGINFIKTDLSNNDFDDETDGIITSITKLNDDDGYIMRSNKKLFYVNENNKIFGLNYGMMPHSKVKYLHATKNKIFASIENNDWIDYQKLALVYSEDGGKVWKKVKDINGGEIIDTLYDDTFYVGSSVTEDGGISWKSVEGKYYDIAFDKNNKNNIYVSDERSLYKTNNIYLTNKVKLNVEPDYAGCHEPISAIVSSNNGSIITSNFYLSKDNGWTWMNLLRNEDKLDFEYFRGFNGSNYFVVPFIFDKDVIAFYYKTDHGFYIYGTYGILYSFDEGNSWKVNKVGDHKDAGNYVGNINDYGSMYIPRVRPIISKKDKIIRIVTNEANGSHSKIIESNDIGKTWIEIASIDSFVNSIINISDKHFIGTNNGLFIETNKLVYELYGGIPMWADISPTIVN